MNGTELWLTAYSASCGRLWIYTQESVSGCLYHTTEGESLTQPLLSSPFLSAKPNRSKQTPTRGQVLFQEVLHFKKEIFLSTVTEYLLIVATAWVSPLRCFQTCTNFQTIYMWEGECLLLRSFSLPSSPLFKYSSYLIWKYSMKISRKFCVIVNFPTCYK